MDTATVTVRPGGEADFDGWLQLYEAVAAEGRWIGREAPVDREEHRRGFLDRFVNNARPAAALVAESGGAQVGQLGLTTWGGIGDIGMAVDASWRGKGVGSALMSAAIEWAGEKDLHKLALQLWPHNISARRLYERFGFVEEGRLRRHYRRRNGELWDAIIMGLVLDQVSPGSPFGPGGG
jgi:RimJ/RimL family protein N-acetyltransferase